MDDLCFSTFWFHRMLFQNEIQCFSLNSATLEMYFLDSRTRSSCNHSNKVKSQEKICTHEKHEQTTGSCKLHF